MRTLANGDSTRLIPTERIDDGGKLRIGDLSKMHHSAIRFNHVPGLATPQSPALPAQQSFRLPSRG